MLVSTTEQNEVHSTQVNRARRKSESFSHDCFPQIKRGERGTKKPRIGEPMGTRGLRVLLQ
jgi:hypothetical protein